MTLFFGILCGSNAVLAVWSFTLNEPRSAWVSAACALGTLVCGAISSRERRLSA